MMLAKAVAGRERAGASIALFSLCGFHIQFDNPLPELLLQLSHPTHHPSLQSITSVRLCDYRYQIVCITTSSLP